MNLYHLYPIKDWTPWYDKCFGVVVRAETEEAARKLSSELHGDEGKKVWLDPNKTTCEILTPEGEEGVIMVDYAAA